MKQQRLAEKPATDKREKALNDEKFGKAEEVATRGCGKSEKKGKTQEKELHHKSLRKELEQREDTGEGTSSEGLAERVRAARRH